MIFVINYLVHIELLAHFDKKTTIKRKETPMKKLTLIVIILIFSASFSYAKCIEKVTIDEIIEMSAQSLSKMECPDFSEIDPGENIVWGIISSAWDKDDDYLIGKLSERISLLSKGSVSLTRGDYEKFPYIVKGRGEYLILKGNGKEIKVFFGPYAKPFDFCKE